MGILIPYLFSSLFVSGPIPPVPVPSSAGSRPPSILMTTSPAMAGQPMAITGTTRDPTIADGVGSPSYLSADQSAFDNSLDPDTFVPALPTWTPSQQEGAENVSL